jgi:hypothetical protein
MSDRDAVIAYAKREIEREFPNVPVYVDETTAIVNGEEWDVVWDWEKGTASFTFPMEARTRIESQARIPKP